MQQTEEEAWQGVTAVDLAPIVCQVLDTPSVEILDWQMAPLDGGSAAHAGFGLGIYRLTGTARVNGETQTWAVVMKATAPSATTEYNDPTHPEYWKAEVLVFQSGILDHLPGPFAVPRCYGVQELPNEEFRIWMEEIQALDRAWTLDDHARTARDLGQFNGAYLAGYPIPEQQFWMLPGRTGRWQELYPPDRDELLALAQTPLASQWLTPANIERMLVLYAARQPLLDALARLPRCFCHHDAFRRNLILRQTSDGSIETVAVDWSHTGPGRVGQEIAITIGANLFFLELDAGQVKEADAAIFDGYCDGLRLAGWHGDARLVRFGYVATAALTFAVTMPIQVARRVHRTGGINLESFMGQPMATILQQWQIAHSFLLDLGDEAVALLPHIA